jgi:heme exporter protein C
VYSIFAFAIFIPLIWVLPRFTDSLHPGNGGNPAFGKYDMDNQMRMVFYPAVIGWTLMGFWLGNLIVRISRLQNKFSAL